MRCEWNGRALDRANSSPEEYGAGRDAVGDGKVTAFALGDAELRCGANTVQVWSGGGGELPITELPSSGQSGIELRSVELAVEWGPVGERGHF